MNVTVLGDSLAAQIVALNRFYFAYNLEVFSAWRFFFASNGIPFNH